MRTRREGVLAVQVKSRVEKWPHNSKKRGKWPHNSKKSKLAQPTTTISKEGWTILDVKS